ncbi:hypothetical protein QWZ13_03330 [Reinekea marina]|uniref:hypothetical protein n=1 Tax=Reinekea marina TaxID=1310421 RepID=UPI0025B3001B|nr:hypothetical protein [Reinekea marina]MDN3647944.1 hypothetical protein [Reinekea marina]
MGRCSRILRRLTSPSMAQIPTPAKSTTKTNLKVESAKQRLFKCFDLTRSTRPVARSPEPTQNRINIKNRTLILVLAVDLRTIARL